MLTAEGCTERRRRLWEAVRSEHSGVEWIVVAQPRHLIHLANYHPSPFEFRSQNAAALLVLERDGTATLLGDNVIEPYVQSAHVTERVAPPWYNGQESAPPRRPHLIETFRDWLGRHSVPAEVAFDSAALPVAVADAIRNQRPGIAAYDVSRLLSGLERRKDEDELAILRLVMNAGAVALDRARRETTPGMTELEVFQFVLDTAIASAGQPVQVYGDFLSGDRTWNSGGVATNRKIANGDPVLLDFSVVLHGYRSDFVNVFICGGKPSARVSELYGICLEALAAGEALLRPGVPCREVFAAINNVFIHHGLEKTFGHHGGHGLGLGHPDAPYIVPQSNETLLPGDVVTLEPGQYHPGLIGMRVERNYLIGESTDVPAECLSPHRLTMLQTER